MKQDAADDAAVLSPTSQVLEMFGEEAPAAEEEQPKGKGKGKGKGGGRVVGTALYAAPEQRRGGVVSTAADMFSLGVMLLEMCVCFGTAMERAAVLGAARTSGALPEELQQQQPEVCALISSLLCGEPAERPTAEAVRDCALLAPYSLRNKAHILHKDPCREFLK